MSPRSIGLSDALQSHVDANASAPDEVQRRLIADTEPPGGAAVITPIGDGLTSIRRR